MDYNAFVLNPHYDKNCPEQKIFDDTLILDNEYKQYKNIFEKGVLQYEHKPHMNPEPTYSKKQTQQTQGKSKYNLDLSDAHNNESKIIHNTPRLYDFCHPREIQINRFEPLHRDIQNPKHVIFPMHRFGAPTHMIGRTKYTRTI